MLFDMYKFHVLKYSELYTAYKCVGYARYSGSGVISIICIRREIFLEIRNRKEKRRGRVLWEEWTGRPTKVRW